MFRNYLKIALRSITRKTTYSSINVIGLSAGLVCVFFIFNWVYDELTYDTHYKNPEKIFRIVAEAGTGEDRWHQTVTSLPLGPTVQSMYPEIESMTRFDYNDAIVEIGENTYFEDDIVLTDPSFFNVFEYPLIHGDISSALNNPYKIVLTESLAEKYFKGQNPVGKSIRLFMYDPDGNGVDYEITGVIADPPEKSHFSFTMLGSISTIEAASEGSMLQWGNNSYYTYITLNNPNNAKSLEAQFPAMVEENIGEMIEQYDLYYRFYLQPIRDIHLGSDLQYEIQANGRTEYVYIFSSIGLLILLLAVINYVNLTTAFSFDRSKETGVRKVMGAQRGELIWQHLTETLVITSIAVVFSLVLVLLIQPLFYELTGKAHINMSVSTVLPQLLLIGIPIGLIAGYLPAKWLSAIPSIASLKGTMNTNSKTSLRSFLVAFQFATTIIILVGVIVVQQQLNFIQSKDLGYDKDNLMILRVNGNDKVRQGFEPFKQELLSNPSITGVARSGSGISNGLGNSNGRVTHPDGDEQFEKIYRLSADYDYLTTYGIELLTGRYLDPTINSDSTEAFVLNEKAISAFGWTPEEALGKEMRFSGMDGRVIGVVKDFHFNSLHHQVEPVCLFIRQNFSRISIKSSDVSKSNDYIATTWKKHFPTALLDYQYQDQALLDSYRSDQRFGQIFNIFSVLSLLIAFLGLFGLVGFSVKRRTKEMGIRKVLGASSLQVIRHISIGFLRLIFLAALVALPIAWYAMDNWLATFPFHIVMNPLFFILSVGVLLVGALGIILIQSLKASLANPATVLKEE